MKLNKLFLLCLIFLCCFSLYSQSNQVQDKYTSVNIVVNTVTYSGMGFIVEYFAGGKFREIYLPNSFFFNGLAVKIIEEDPKIAPQINVIYKNLAPLKVKLYMPSVTMGAKYPVIEFIPKEIEDKFNNTKKLEIILKD